MLDEVRSFRRVPFTSNRAVHTSAQVYEHGREAFVDGSENQEAISDLMELIEDYKVWFAEHEM